jgi:putative restriction endonuclease
MPVNFDKLNVGHEYDRPFLAELWGYEGYQALSRGVVTPVGTNLIILFVTKKKQQGLKQYNDYIDGNTLHWEGEEKHTSDNRIINSAINGGEIHLFYREIHHSPFVYLGQASLKGHQVLVDRPSEFVFLIGKEENLPNPIDDIENHKAEYSNLNETEQLAIVKSRIGQGLFRDVLVKMWGGCSVTGLSNLLLLRASHVKPWRVCSNSERLDPMNGLLLHPVLDHLFDAGLVTFEEDGKIRISELLSTEELKILSISPSAELREVPIRLEKYMEYHREHVFKKG